VKKVEHVAPHKKITPEGVYAIYFFGLKKPKQIHQQ